MKMKQPELGRKISELRKAKGLTQEELVEKCHLSVRTLQRIESGEVTPRSHTIKVILEALEYSGKGLGMALQSHRVMQVLQWFNLKHNTMKKVSVLTSAMAISALIWMGASNTTSAQHVKRVQKVMESNNENYIKWFNSGNIERLLSQYHEDACILAYGCGADRIKAHFQQQQLIFSFEKLELTSLSVSGDLAVEKGEWQIRLKNGETHSGVYMTEWKKEGKQWLILNEISQPY